MEKRTVVDRIEVEIGTGRVFIRCLKQIIDGDVVEKSEPYRSPIDPDLENPSDQIKAINSNLKSMGYPTINVSDEQAIYKHVELVAPQRAAALAEAKKRVAKEAASSGRK